MAISLQAARRREADRQARQVDKITRELDAETDAVIRNAPRLIDGRELRGWPAIGRGVRGQVTDQPTPGDDAHLERLAG